MEEGQMKSIKFGGSLVLLLLLAVISALGQGVKNTHPVSVPQGQKVKVQGVVSQRDNDMFKVRDPGGAETTVLMTASTKVSSHSKGLRGKQAYPVTYIMRGLRLQAEGRGDADGNLVADWVRFDEQDLRSAQALEQTDELAQENQARLAAAEQAAQEAAANAERMAGQIAENTALAKAAAAKAQAAQDQADAAFKAAALANNRINGLDDYEVIRTISILFKVNSNIIDATARQTIDEAAAWAKGEKA